jgi:hypothetical protein
MLAEFLESNLLEISYLEFQEDGGRIKIDLKEIRSEDMSWRHLTQGRIEMWVLIFEMLNLKCLLPESLVVKCILCMQLT